MKPKPKVILNRNPHELINQWVSQVEAGHKEGLDSLSFAAQRFIRALFDLAQSGNSEAAGALVAALSSGVRDLEKLCLLKPEVFEPRSRKSSLWPGFLTCDPDQKRKNETLVSKLNLGRDASLNYFSKPWDGDTIGTAVAKRLYFVVKSYRDNWQHGELITKSPKSWSGALKIKPGQWTAISQKSARRARGLEPMTKSNSHQWYAAAMPLLAALYGKDFEKHKRFAGYTGARWEIRNAITKDIRQGFKSIAQK